MEAVGKNSQTESKKERKIFPQIRWHSSYFTVILVCWAPNSAWCQWRGKQTVLSGSKVQSHQRGKPSGPTASRLLPLNVSKNVTKATNSEANGKHQQQALSVFIAVFFFFFHLHVSLKRKLVRRARPAQLLKIPLWGSHQINWEKCVQQLLLKPTKPGFRHCRGCT